jgi:hypothetical protein
MSTIKKTISIDEKIVNEATAIAPNFSAVVETALIEYIQHRRTAKAIQSFGKWGERKESSSEIVNDLRRQDDREYVKRNDTNKKKLKKKK